MTTNPLREFMLVPTRLLLDTCVLNCLYDYNAYVFDGMIPEDMTAEDIDDNVKALRAVVDVHRRANFQFLVSPLTVAEVANIQSVGALHPLLAWVLEMLEHWLILLDYSEDRVSQGGSVRHRFKLTPELQDFEAKLMGIGDFRRDPFDRLLLVQYRMGNCHAFLTTDEDTIWRHREQLASLDVRVLRPVEYWELLRPWAPLWC